MSWLILGHLFSTLVDWISIGRLSSREKDLELLLLRQQLALVQRRLDKAVRSERVEKLMVAVLTAKLKAVTQCPTQQLGKIIRLFQPETVLKWHRELVRRKWRYQRGSSGGRPRTKAEVEALILQFVRENTDWCYGKLEGELRKLGFAISEQTVANILNRHGIAPAPRRNPSSSWRHLMQHYKTQILACDFFTVETLFLHTVYVLFFIELQTRRVYFAGCTTHPDGPWVTQQPLLLRD
jgi:putative transposase